MSELKRYAFTHQGEEMGPVYVRFDDVKATVQPLVDALEKAIYCLREENKLRYFTDELESTLAAYREAMGVEG